VLGLPESIKGCLFDLDGVLTQTAKVHDAAWKEMFDDFLRKRAEASGQKFVPFDPVADYDDYVDGKPRDEGTRSFLESRGIHLDTDAIEELGNRKNEIVLRRLAEDGVQTYPGSVKYVQAVKEAGLRRAVVSSSTNCKQVLEAAGIADLFEARIDGIVAEREHLHGKPAPDTFLAGAKSLGLPASECTVFEDALAGVAAGKAGGFGFVVGVDRVGQADALREHGASVVVSDLSELA
jgi:beta-phosphoglucomutase family hydrolase